MRSFFLAKCGVFLFFLVAFIGAFIPEAAYTKIYATSSIYSISLHHPFGTDILGRDILIRMVRGAYTVCYITIPSMIFGGGIGVILGMLSAKDETWLRFVVGIIMDIIFAFPLVLVSLLIVTRIGSGPFVATIALSLFFLPVFYRVIYLSARAIWHAEYITSARLNGLGTYGILLRHITPNIFPIIVGQISINFSVAILIEAGLGYLGLSVRPPDPTWGSLLFDVQRVIFVNPAAILPMGLTIFLTVLSFSTVGDHVVEKYKKDFYAR